MSVYKSLNNMNCMSILLPINVHFRCLIVLRYYNQLPITVRQCPVLQFQSTHCLVCDVQCVAKRVNLCWTDRQPGWASVVGVAARGDGRVYVL